MKLPLALFLIASLAVPAAPVRAQGDDDSGTRLDIEAVQAVLAVQQLDGWLLYDQRGQNPLAVELVGPSATTTRQWFYFVPARGQPSLLVHKSEVGAFERVPGKKIEYAGYRDLKQGLTAVLKGATKVAMEYAPGSGIPSLTRVDAAAADLVRKSGVQIESSADLVQLTKSLWGPEGRVAHYVAAHHLSKLREEALDYVATRIGAGETVTERDVQQLILRGYKVRGLVGDPPVVATGRNTAQPTYRPTARRTAVIHEGDLLLLELSGAIDGVERPIVANITWVAYVGKEVPARYAEVFATVAEARDAAIDLIRDRVSRRRAVKGFEADQKARHVIGKAGLGERFVHRTGHSLDTSLHGDGANLDDYETHDTRNLVVGSGFTVGPGVYIPRDFGLRTEVGMHIGRGGAEVTSARQAAITPVLAE